MVLSYTVILRSNESHMNRRYIPTIPPTPSPYRKRPITGSAGTQTPVSAFSKAPPPTKSTLDKSIVLVETPARSVAETITTRKAGLGLALVGLAEGHTRRLARFSRLVERVEELLFTDTVFAQAADNPALLAQLYDTITRGLHGSTRVIMDVLERVDLDQLGVVLRQVEDEERVSATPQGTEIVSKIPVPEKNPSKFLHSIAQMLAVEKA